MNDYLEPEPIGCSGEPSPEPVVPIGNPFAAWPTPTPGALTALGAAAACGAVLLPLMAELFWPAAVALGPSEGAAGVKKLVNLLGVTVGPEELVVAELLVVAVLLVVPELTFFPKIGLLATPLNEPVLNEPVLYGP
jgi:hypothetical protein